MVSCKNLGIISMQLCRMWIFQFANFSVDEWMDFRVSYHFELHVAWQTGDIMILRLMHSLNIKLISRCDMAVQMGSQAQHHTDEETFLSYELWVHFTYCHPFLAIDFLTVQIWHKIHNPSIHLLWKKKFWNNEQQSSFRDFQGCINFADLFILFDVL